MMAAIRSRLSGSRRDVAACALALASAVAAFSASALFSACGAPSAKNPKQLPATSPRPAGLDHLTNVTDLSAGYKHTCAIANGGAYCWGMNTTYQLGTGTTTDNSNPTAVIAEGSGATQVSAGAGHSCAVVAGALKCWGDNTNGQLGMGVGDTATRSTPTTVPGLAGVTAVAAGTYHTCAISAGALYCWGANTFGMLGDGTNGGQVEAPQAVPAPMNAGVTAIAVGKFHTCALKTNAVYCWGRGTDQQIGDGAATERDSPTLLAGLSATSIAGGDTHTCAVTTAGGVKCWGTNDKGQVGEATFTTQGTPYDAIPAASGATQVACGALHTCAVVSGGIQCWGNDNNNELNDNAGGFTGAPVAVDAASSGDVWAGAGGQHSCRVSGTTASCWGSNSNGQAGY